MHFARYERSQNVKSIQQSFQDVIETRYTTSFFNNFFKGNLFFKNTKFSFVSNRFPQEIITKRFLDLRGNCFKPLIYENRPQELKQ